MKKLISLFMFAILLIVAPSYATVSSEDMETSFACDGATSTFAFNFYTISQDDLSVIVRDSSGVETTLNLAGDYTVTLTTTTGGSITLIDAANDCITGETIHILRQGALVQGTNYTPYGPFPAETTEQAFDELTMHTQALRQQTERSLKVNTTSSLTESNLALSPSANQALCWDSAGTAITNCATSVITANNLTTLSDDYNSSLATMVTDIGAGFKTVIVDVANSVTDNLTIPTNISLIHYCGAITTVTINKDLTINGQYEAPPCQTFDADNDATTGDVEFGYESGAIALPEWWTANAVPGTTDMTTAIQSAVDAYSSSPRVQFGIAQYLVTDEILVYKTGGVITGHGGTLTKILFIPTAADKAAFVFASDLLGTPASIGVGEVPTYAAIYQNGEISGFYFQSDADASPGAPYVKTAIKVVNGANFKIRDIQVAQAANWGADSIGIHTKGHEAIEHSSLDINADRPIVVDIGSFFSGINLDADHFTYENMTLTGKSGGTFPVIDVNGWASMTSVTFYGRQAWVNGADGFHREKATWATPSDSASRTVRSENVSFHGVRTEGATDPLTWSFYFALDAVIDGGISINDSKFENGREAVFYGLGGNLPTLTINNSDYQGTGTALEVDAGAATSGQVILNRYWSQNGSTFDWDTLVPRWGIRDGASIVTYPTAVYSVPAPSTGFGSPHVILQNATFIGPTAHYTWQGTLANAATQTFAAADGTAIHASVTAFADTGDVSIHAIVMDYVTADAGDSGPVEIGSDANFSAGQAAVGGDLSWHRTAQAVSLFTLTNNYANSVDVTIEFKYTPAP